MQQNFSTIESELLLLVPAFARMTNYKKQFGIEVVSLYKRSFMILFISIIIFFFYSCSVTVRNKVKNPNENFDTCRTFYDIKSHKNQHLFVKGRIQKYIPGSLTTETEKMVSGWEIVLRDSVSLSLIPKGKEIKIEQFENRDVLIFALVYYGNITTSNAGLDMTGYRIDA